MQCINSSMFGMIFGSKNTEEKKEHTTDEKSGDVEFRIEKWLLTHLIARKEIIQKRLCSPINLVKV